MYFNDLTAGLVILPSWIGTLKSTRISTRLPLREPRSVIESLLERDMVVLVDEETRVACSFSRGSEPREDCLWGVPDRENIDCPCNAGLSKHSTRMM